MPSVLFVCTANRIRSPLAAAEFQRMLREQGRTDGWTIRSAGTWTPDGLPADKLARKIARELDLNLEDHRTAEVNAQLLATQDLIVTMAANQREAVESEFPSCRGRIFRLSFLAGSGSDVRDPIGQDLDACREVAHEICDLLHLSFDRILALATSNHSCHSHNS